MAENARPLTYSNLLCNVNLSVTKLIVPLLASLCCNPLAAKVIWQLYVTSKAGKLTRPEPCPISRPKASLDISVQLLLPL